MTAAEMEAYEAAHADDADQQYYRDRDKKGWADHQEYVNGQGHDVQTPRGDEPGDDLYRINEAGVVGGRDALVAEVTRLNAELVERDAMIARLTAGRDLFVETFDGAREMLAALDIMLEIAESGTQAAPPAKRSTGTSS